MIARLSRRSLRSVRKFSRLGWRIVTRPFKWTVDAVEAVLKFAAAWWSRRDFRHLLWGLPALLTAVVSAYLVLASLARSPAVRADQYLLAGRSALRSKSWSSARMYLERAWELNPGSHELLFDLATAASGLGDAARVNVIMQRLAPEDAAVHAPAHLAKANALLQQREQSSEAVRRAERHLQHVLTLEPGNRLGHRLRGGMYFEQGLYAQAIQHLSGIAASDPEVALTLAKAYGLSGELELARHWGGRAERYFESRTLARPRDVDSRLAWAEAVTFLDEYERAARILLDGRTINDEPRLRESLARVYALWADSLVEAGVATRPQRFELLSQALLMSPEDLFLFDRIMGLLRESGPDSEARKFLLENLTSGRAVSMSHLLLGTYSCEQSHTHEARFHLEQAFQASPFAPVIANNLAWVLLNNPPIEPDRALGIMEAVVEKFPSDHRFLDTRGQAYVKLGRWREGIADLEAALATHKSQVLTRKSLAEAYRALGQEETAESHRLAAEQLERGLLR